MRVSNKRSYSTLSSYLLPSLSPSTMFADYPGPFAQGLLLAGNVDINTKDWHVNRNCNDFCSLPKSQTFDIIIGYTMNRKLHLQTWSRLLMCMYIIVIMYILWPKLSKTDKYPFYFLPGLYAHKRLVTYLSLQIYLSKYGQAFMHQPVYFPIRSFKL